jgi:hypothetical protein
VDITSLTVILSLELILPQRTDANTKRYPCSDTGRSPVVAERARELARPARGVRYALFGTASIPVSGYER